MRILIYEYSVLLSQLTGWPTELVFLCCMGSIAFFSVAIDVSEQKYLSKGLEL
jgi:hypothetical protein